MSWSDIFPLMDDSLINLYRSTASETEKAEVRDFFRVESVHNLKSSKHLVSTSLFWKPAFSTDQDYPAVTRELMQDPNKAGLPSRIKNPWSHYFLPILKGAKTLNKGRSDATLRIYLAKDLEFLIPDLTGAGCEVFLMASSSIRHNPGAMWRFLAMEEDRLVTITDSDRAPRVIHDIHRTDEISKTKLSYWRVPYFIGAEDDGVGSPGTYRTTLACQFGSTSPIPMRILSEAFVWNCLRGHIGKVCSLGNRVIPIFGSKWPTFGFDEFFLNTVVFPRIASEGMVTFISWNGATVGMQPLNHWFALDIEYCNWANSNSEIVFFGDAAHSGSRLAGSGQDLFTNIE